MHQVETWIVIGLVVANIVALVLLRKKQNEIDEKDIDDRFEEFGRSHRDDMDRLWLKVSELEDRCQTKPTTNCCRK